MGSWCSGPRRSATGCLDDQLPIDVRQLKRLGALAIGQISEWTWTVAGDVHVAQVRAQPDRLTVRSDTSQRYARLDLALVKAPCTYGGIRHWFQCPGCMRSAAILYAAVGFVCRRCVSLPYRSQNRRAVGRALLRASRIRRRLGGTERIIDSAGRKPKGMHWRTYARLRRELDIQARICVGVFEEQLRRIHRSVPQLSAPADLHCDLRQGS